LAFWLFLGPFPAAFAATREGKPLAIDQALTFQFYRKKALRALVSHREAEAKGYLELADIFASTDEERQEVQSLRETFGLAPAKPARPAPAPVQPAPQAGQTQATSVPPAKEPKPPQPPQATQPIEPVQPSKSIQPMPAQPPLPAQNTRVYDSTQDSKKPVERVTLSEITGAGQPRNAIRIVLGGAVIIEDRNIQRFLVVDEGFIEVKIIDHNQMRIDARRRGSTFLHIWDDNGRTTLFVEVILPASTGPQAVGGMQSVEHSRPFRFTYSNDWSAYYSGNEIPNMRRQNVTFYQYLGMDGETPYGVLDAAATFKGFDDLSDVPSYTVGLSHIPMPGTSDLNLRGFDAVRNVSILTLPGSHLRGVFGDVNVLDNMLGASYSYGQLQPAFGFLTSGSSTFLDSYVNAVKVSLFPMDENTHYSLNFASGYGSERPTYLTRRAYSVEGQQKIQNVTLKAELARNDESHSASLTGIRWQQGPWDTAFNFRDINRDYTTVVSPPANQGEIGAIWTGNAEFEKLSAQTIVDVYRNRLYFNPDNSGAYNLDTRASLHGFFNRDLWWDGNASYTDTPGELSPRRNVTGDLRLSRGFDTWNARKGTLYGGGLYQKNRNSSADALEYDRYTAVAGFQLPLTSQLSTYASYEYSLVHEPFSGDDFHPNVFTAGATYTRPFTDKFSGTLRTNYRKENGVKGTNSFLAGEDSLEGSIGLTYNPANDVSVFFDGRLRRVWSKIVANPSYYDMDLRVGMRMALGTPVRWDPVGGIGGYVYKDKEGSGRHNTADQGIANVKVKVGDKEVITDKKGWYYAQVRGKRVLVTPVQETVPSGFIYSSPTFGQTEVRQGQFQRVDFGLTSHSSIYGVVFADKNGNGIPDAGDKMVGRVKLILDGKVTQASDTRGTYYFRNISQGKHTIEVDLNTIPINMIPLIKVKSDIEVSEGATYMFHVPLKLKAEE